MYQLAQFDFLGPANASEQGEWVGALWMGFLAVVVVAAVLTHVLGLWALVRRNRHPDTKRANVRVEATWAVLSGLLLLALFIASERVWASLGTATASEEAGPPQRVMVIGEQFKWSVIYPGPDGAFGRYLVYPKPTDARWPNPHITDAVAAETPPPFEFAGVPGPAALPVDERESAIADYIEQVNPLGKVYTDPAGWDDDADYARALGRPIAVTAGRPVEIVLGSRDVIHDFFVPAMRVKLDAIPGLWGRLRFTPITSGTYDVLCAEFCGYGHYTMSAQLVVEDPA